MNKDWEEIWTKEVTSNLHINLPSDLEERITFEDPLHGPSVVWSYDEHADVIVVSDEELEKDRYEHVKSTETVGSGQIRPPKDLMEKTSRPIYQGLIIAYLAHEEMLSEDSENSSSQPISVYLLTESQVLTFMNEVPGESDGDSLRKKLQETPAFLPPVK
ncbi:hypothetical protein BRD19_09870 [Halobacteriales archaeon SW_7_65_23]|nr:MAG: hypothetical protein BRD19_09870 [Halobacteriales archaeon SW_7_65_23]